MRRRVPKPSANEKAKKKAPLACIVHRAGLCLFLPRSLSYFLLFDRVSKRKHKAVGAALKRF